MSPTQTLDPLAEAVRALLPPTATVTVDAGICKVGHGSRMAVLDLAGTMPSIVVHRDGHVDVVAASDTAPARVVELLDTP